MKVAQTTTHAGIMHPTEFNRLPINMRERAAELKYADAVAMYADTSLPICRVAEINSVSATGLSSHIRTHHRNLLFERYGIDVKDDSLYNSIKVKPPKGQSLKTHLKYKDAIEACGDMTYIELNVSQVAQLFNLNGSSLAAQLRVHYPDIIPNREKVRQRLGIADNAHRGPRRECVEAYSEAMVMYRDSDLTIAEVAEKFGVSSSGLCRFLRFYHKDVLSQKSNRRKTAKKAVGVRKPGKLSGNGNLYGPKAETINKYADALELYRSSSLSIREIAAATGVPEAGFKGYLRQWHRCEMLDRRGFECDADSIVNLQETKRFLKATAAKYAPAIASLKENPRHVAEVAAEFGLNPEVFRKYLKNHEPELASQQGMMRQSNGKLIKYTSSEKYAQAINEYASSAESLKSIAQRHGLVYNSICGYVARNCPEEKKRHQLMVEAAESSKKNK